MPNDHLRRRAFPPPAWFSALAFVLALSVIAPTAGIRQSDDYHYLEASMHMARGGDLTLPRAPNGELRLKKPVFTYWPLALSFHALGYSIWAARLPFLLACGFTVWLTGALGGRLTNRQAGRWGAMILAATIPWLLAGLRMNPDPWLCLFTTASAGGFLLRLGDDESADGRWLGWLGLGLAVAAKGLVALVVVPPVLLVAWWSRGRAGLRRLWFWPAAALGAAIGLYWYLAVAARLGPGALSPFLADQLLWLAPTPSSMLHDMASAVLFLSLALLPWTALAIAARRSDWRGALARRAARTVAWFAALFALALTVVSVAAFQFSGGRYLLPALPWLALLMAMGLERAAEVGRPGPRFRGILVTALALCMLVLVFGAVWLAAALGRLEGSQGTGWRIAAISIAALAVLVGTRSGPRRSQALMALLVISFPALLYGNVRAALPDPVDEIVRGVERLAPPGPVLMVDRGLVAGFVHVRSGGRVVPTGIVSGLPPAHPFGTLVVPAERLDDEAYPGCSRERIATDYRRVPPGELLAAIRAGRAEAFLKDYEQPYLLVRCPDSDSSASQ